MIKKGNQVEMICGKDKGKKGEVIEILRKRNKVKIKGNFICRTSISIIKFRNIIIIAITYFKT